MDLEALRRKMENCPCGVKHECELKALEVAHGNLGKTGDILKKYAFPTHILMVADKNSFTVTSGLAENLLAGGFSVQMRVYDDTKVATMEAVNEIKAMLKGVDGVLSVGTGSINDICRYAAFLAEKPMAIFATAPSMDGFSSGVTPLIEKGFKITRSAQTASDVLIDPAVLCAAPRIMIGAGVGDILAKYCCLTDWRISFYLTGETYGEEAASLMYDAVRACDESIPALAAGREEGVGKLMEALLISGYAMVIAGNSRPAFEGCERVYAEADKLPSPEYVEGILSSLGCPTRFSSLGVSAETVRTMFFEAYKIRDRFTVLTLYCTKGWMKETADELMERFF